ncbi:MAG: N-acetylmuramoyl-L-alanine amidase [bacterium]
MLGKIIVYVVLMSVLFLTACSSFQKTDRPSPLAGKIVCIDPGHGGTAATDQYRVGQAGEREEWIDLRVGLILQDLLLQRGARVVMTRAEDTAVGLKERADLAVNNHADVFVSIHHNATADRSVNFPIIYYHGKASENQASVELGRCLALRVREAMHDRRTPVSLCSDHTIFPESGTGVLRNSYGIPGVIGEASFFSNPEEETRLKDENHNRCEAEAYVRALEDFFLKSHPPIKAKSSIGQIPPFRPLVEADRMKDEARRWHQDYQDAMAWYGTQNPRDYQIAYDLFTQSAKSFPDSYVARDCHFHRALLLDKLGKAHEAGPEYLRAREYYVPTP